ncbi:MAG: VIT1/CCC1 transporter family protein [Planktomarina sp.]
MNTHEEHHFTGRTGWLRAAVLGANDGLLSTASLIVGVAAAATSSSQIMLAGVAGIVAGALSMAAGEYVSVSSQADSERADLAREQAELDRNLEGELEELVDILRTRGLSDATARQAAHEMTAYDALGTHAREEIGISDALSARPLEAAWASALAFLVGGAAPLLMAAWAPIQSVALFVSLATVCALLALGATGAKLGGAPMGRGAVRVAFWGVIAMAVTYAIGSLFGAQL